MQDSPLTLRVVWEKARVELLSLHDKNTTDEEVRKRNARVKLIGLWQIRKNDIAHYPQKKKKPRGNGASRGNKQ